MPNRANTAQPANEVPGLNAVELFQAIFATSTNLMAVTRADDGSHVDVSSAWQSVLGFSRDEAIGKTPLELGIWHESGRHHDMHDLLEQTGIVRDFRATLQSKNGTLCECLISVSPLDLADERYHLFSADDVTALQALQDKVRQAEYQNKISTERAKLGFWRWSLTENRMTDWSEVHALFNPGRGPAPVTYDDMVAFLHPDDREWVLQVYRDADRDTTGYDIEFRVINADGETRWLRGYAEVENDEDGVAIAQAGFDQDITEIKQARDLKERVERDEELRRHTIMSRQAVRMARLGHWFWDEIEDHCIWCNDQIPAMYGLTKDQYMESKTLSGPKMDQVHPEDRDYVREIYRQSFAGKRDYEVEYRVIYPDGSIHWLRETGAVYEMNNNEITSTIGTILDITQDELAQRKLEESESRNRSIVETAGDAILTIDEHGTIETFNRAAERIFGFERNKIIGKNVKRLMPEPYASNHDTYLANYLRTGNARIIGIGGEVEGLCADGSTFPMLLAVSEIETTGKRIFTGIIRDISDLKEVERQALADRDEAEKANTAKTEFLAHMSHEFRTPLNAIIGFSEALHHNMFGELGHPKNADYVADILHSGYLLLDIVNDILDISRVEAGEVKLAEDTFPPLPAIQECIATVHGFSTKTGGPRITSKDNAPSHHLLADKRIFKQILLNLLSNAVKFTPDDGTITVTTDADADGGLIVRITDTGFGIPEEDLAVVIEPFGQSRPGAHTTHKGTGLGLSLSRLLTELHDGTLTLESERDKGTTVTLRFPPERSIKVQG